MTSFLLEEIKNKLRIEGYEVKKHTNRRVINDLLKLEKNSTFRNICEKLKMTYIEREGDHETNNSIRVFLHFLDSETTLGFSSLTEAGKKLGIDIVAYRYERERVLEKTIFVNGERAVLSLSDKIDRDYNFPPCLENKVNINLALSQKLGYVVDYNISLFEIFSILDEKVPDHRLKEKLCSFLEIPYYLERKGGQRNIKKVKAIAGDEVLVFSSLNNAGKFFQTSSTQISNMIKLGYRIPLWYKRYSLKFV